MITLNGDYFLYIDCDDTLITTDLGNESAIPITYEIGIMKCTDWKVPHKKHIQEIINHKKNKNAVVVVWTQNTVEWAEAVVKALGLEPYVDLVTSKPHRIIDDLPFKEWMPEREWEENK